MPGVDHRVEAWRARRRLRALACAAAVALALCAAPPARAAAGPPLVFLGNRNLPPAVYEEDGAPAGVAVDLVRALAPHLSRPVDVRAADWTTAQALVFRGEADALVQMNPSEERRQLYDFSAPLLESRFSIFVRRDSLAIPGPSALRGLTVGVEAGGLPEQVLSKDPTVHLVRIPDFLTGFGLLVAYDLDAVVVDWRVGSYVLATQGLRDVTVTGEPVATSWSAIAVRKGNAALLAEIDAGLRAIRADGTYDRILERWRPKEVVFWTREEIARVVAVAAIVVLSLLLLTTGLWMHALRRELRRRRAAEAELAARTAVLDGVIDGADAGIFSVDREHRYTSFNAAHATAMKVLHGVEVAIGRSALDGVAAEDVARGRPLLERALAGEHLTVEDWYGAGAARRYFRVAYGPIRGGDGAVIGATAVSHDLTDRKHAEETVRRVNRQLRALTSSNKALLRASDERTLLEAVCRIIVDEAGYRMAWVGYAETGPDKAIRPVAWAGIEDGYLTSAALTWADVPRGQGPSGTAIRSGATACIQDFAGDSSAAPWRTEALARGFRSSTAIPLQDGDGRTFGVLCIYSGERGAFVPDERRLVEELAADLALGINVLRARAELQRAEQQRVAHLHFLESMDRVNRAITGTADVDQMLRDVLDVVLSVFDCDRTFLLFPVDPAAATWACPVERCRAEYPGAGLLGREVPTEPDIAEKFRLLLASDAPVRFGPGAHPLPPTVAARFGIRSMMSMVIRPKTGPPWEFGIQHCARDRAWTVDEEWLLQEIGRRLADALSTLVAVRDLRESEARLAKAERMVHVGYWDLDVATSRMQLSEEACRIFGVPPELRAWDFGAWRARWATLVHPEDRERADAAITDAVAHGTPGFDVELRVAPPGGDARWIHAQGEITRGADGRPLRVLTTVQDVTDRRRAGEALRRSEEQYRRIVETAHEGIWVIDAAARTTFVNRQMAEMLRCPAEELRGALLTEFLDEDDHGIVGPALARGRAPGGSPHELRLLRRDGTDLWALVQLTPFLDDGVYTGALAMVTDVTERRGIEAQLRQSQKLEAVGRLAGGVAHDFNNLLTAILSDAQVLADGVGPDNPLHTEAVEIEAAARKAALLTRQLLAFGRKQRTEPRVVDVGDVLAAMDRMLRRLIGEDVELSTSASTGLGRIRVDPVQLEQVLLNLAVNARDAMPDGGRLRVEATNVDGPAPDGAPGVRRRWVMVSVRDTGVGMSPEVQAHLFEPFFTTKEPGKGTGLGLATVYGIVQQAGGNVRVRSEPGRGTSFEILFPRVDGPADADAAPPSRELTRGSGRLLVVEDEPLVRALAVRVLRGAGYEVLEAADAEQALALVDGPERARIDLLVTDVVMPRCSGTELAHRLRAKLPELPVLFASGYMDRVEDVQRELGPGTGFMAKPFTADELARRVRELLQPASTWDARPVPGTVAT